MPAFTAIGAAVVSYLGGAAVLGSFGAIVVGAVVATGAAYITSRIINGNPNKGNNSSAGSQGGRIQVPPATNNKIPVLYGSAYVNGIITDARLISTDQKTNNTMFYCIVLSETCNTVGAAYTLNNVYWNDLRLTSVDSTTNAHKIKDGRKTVDGPGEDFIDTNFVVDGASLVEVRVYAGSSAANKQIFPTQASGNTQAAYDFWGNNDNSWTTDFAMTGLVFAIVKVTYNGEKGFTALPNMTFNVSNSINNPADVWLDYMTGVRYGANIAVSDINTSANTAWKNFCNEDINYTNKDGTTNQATERYTINGLLDTNRSVKENIDIILQNGGAWMSYDVATGLWSPVIKKAITAGDPDTPASYFTASRSGTTLTVTTFPEGRIEAGQNLYNSAGSLIGTIVAQLTPTAGETAGQKGRYTTSTTGTITTTTFYTTAPNLLSFSDDNIISGISISSTRLDDLYNKVEVEFYDQYNKDQKAYYRVDIPAGELNPNEPVNQLRMSLDLCNNSMQADILGQMELRQSRDDLVIEFTSNHYGIQAQAGDIINVYSDLYDWPPKLFRVMRVKEQETEEGGLVAQIQALEYNGDAYTIEPITEFTTEENIGIGVYGASPNLPAPPDVIIAAVDADVAIPNFQLQVTIPSSGGPYDEIELYYTEGWDEMTVSGSIVPGTGSNGAPVGKGLLTITSTPQGHINAGDRIDLGSSDIYVVSQITNNPVSKTYVSGGVPVSVDPATTTSRLITLNNVTGLLIGHTLTGTGIPNGSFILEINPTGSPANTVRIEDAVTAQAAGTYTVTGGLGTYIVDTSTTLSGSALLYDFPEADNYKLLKKITPEGNNPTFVNGAIILDTITNVPANSATYRRWFIKARMGIKKRFGGFSTPGATDYETGRFPYKPNPTAAGRLSDLLDVNITSPTEGNSFYYDATTSKWRNTNIITVDDVNLRVGINDTSPSYALDVTGEINLTGENLYMNQDNTDADVTVHFNGGRRLKWSHTNQRFEFNGDTYISDDLTVDGGNINLNGTAQAGVKPFLTFATQADGTNSMYGIRGMSTVDDPWFVGGASTGDDAGYLEIATGDNSGGSNNGGEIYVRQYNGSGIGGAPWYGGSGTIQNTLTLLDNIGNTTIPNSLLVNDVLFVDHANNRVGVNVLSPNFALDVGGDAYISGDITVAGNTIQSSSASAIQLSGADVEVIGDLTVTGNDIKKSGGTTVVTFSGTNLTTFAGDIVVTGNTIQSSSAAAIQLSGANVEVIGDLTITGNDVYSGGGTLAIQLSGADVTVAGDLTVEGNDIKSSTGATALTFSNTNVTVAGDLTVTGNDIKSSSATALTLNGANVTVAGDLTVSGANINTGVDDVILSIDRTTTGTSGVFRRALILKSASANAPAVGFGTAMSFTGQTSLTNFEDAGYIAVTSTDDTAGSEDFQMSFGLMQNGASYTDKVIIDSAGNLQINGNNIKASTGATAITLSGSNVAIAGDLTVTGNDIKSSTSATALTLSGADVAVAGDLTVTGNNIKSSSATALTLSGANVQVDGDLTVFGDEIKSSSLTTAITLSGIDAAVTGKITAISADLDGGILTMYDTSFGIRNVETKVIYDLAVGNLIQTADFWTTSYRTGKYTISMTKGTDYHSMDIMILHDGTTAYMNVYSEIITNTSLATFSADISSGTVRLRITPTTTGDLDITMERKLFT